MSVALDVTNLRDAGPDDGVCGVPARFVASPTTTDEVCAVLALASRSGWAVVPRGSGTKLGWGNPPERCDVLLDLSGLDRLVDHAAGDLVAVVEAGRRLDDLQADLARSGQCLAVDPSRRGTVGGLVATGSTGPNRLLYGAVRDLVIGSTMVRANGVVAKSGGRVVKNVAGYDLGKLLTGSYGTLAVVTQVAFRLHPLPEATRFVVAPVASSSQARELVLRALHSPLVPTACELDWTDDRGQVAIRIDGTRAGVEARTDEALALLGPGAEAVEEPTGWWGAEPEGEVLLKVTHEPASLGTVLDLIEGDEHTHTRGSAAVGTLHVAVPERVAIKLVGQLRSAATEFGGAVVVLEAPESVRDEVDVWGPVRGLDLMRRVKERFDPERVLSPGRFVGGI